MAIELKSRHELNLMRTSGKVVAEILALLFDAAKPGVTLDELDQLAHKEIIKAGATSSFLNYLGYPKVLCASVNHVVVHGIPGPQVLQEGDLLSLDFGVSLSGFHADAARTITVGAGSPERKRLIEVTEESLRRGVEQVQIGQRLGDIGAAIQRYVEGEGYSVVRDFVGHGIGRRMHEEPQVPNYGREGTGLRLKRGLVIAIEPMVNVGTWEVDVLEDGWTVVTRDGQDSAHFENTVALTDNGPEILTLLPGER